MQNKIKNKLEKSLKSYIRKLDKSYSLKKLSPLLYRRIDEFVLRKGKRLRPTLLVLGYLGFAKKVAPNLYTTALSIELLHDFMLVHDDIIDKSTLRRGKPAMHKMLDKYLRKFRNIKFDGRDLTIVAGDVMYAMAIDTFLSIKEKTQRKEEALRRLVQSTIYTGMGEFIEILNGIQDIARIKKEDVYRIYDYKTADYSFACPLSLGAILAGAPAPQVNKLHRYGIYLGRAFQIKDDIIGIYREQKEIGKSPLTDLQEAKKTILVWYAYKNSNNKVKTFIRKVFNKRKVSRDDLIKMRALIKSSGALDYAQKRIIHLIKKAQAEMNTCRIKKQYLPYLNSYCEQLLKL